MKNSEFLSKLRESGWRRKLTAAEQAELQTWLAAHPEAQAEWEMELRLNAALSRLPDVPVPSNFTARVMQAIETVPAHGWHWRWRVLMPRIAFATVIITFGGLVVHQHEVDRQRLALVRSVALVTQGQPVPSPEALENFDTIRRLSQPQHADDELIALMQ